MARKSERPLEKVTVRLHQGDKEALDSWYPHSGHNKVIRHLVASHLKQLEAEANKMQQPANKSNEANKLIMETHDEC